MFLTYLMFGVALCLSAIAEFYSIAGLAAIFAGAVIPIVIMGVILGVAKLSITVWLHEYWHQARLLMKGYLVSAVVVLMFLTSMGIFGFLSKAHIEQVGIGQETTAQLQRIDVELKRQTEIVAKAEERAKTLETTGTGADANVNSQIRTEQARIDSALARVQPAIDEQQRIIDSQTKLYSDQVAKIDEQLAQLQKFIDAKEVDRAQALVGVKTDGDWGPGTARAVNTWKAARAQERVAAVAKLEEANRDPTIKSARDEILRIRKTVETQVAESNKLIDRLRNQLGKGDTASVEALVNEQQEKIKQANAEIETLTQKKYALEAEYRKLEVEVGPIKYIADMIYGDSADHTVLEKAVRWMILLIVAVFDPLAVMMLLAATESRTWNKPQRKEPDLDPVYVEDVTAPPPVTAEPEPIVKVKKRRIRKWRRKEFNWKKQTEDEFPETTTSNAESFADKEARRLWKAENPGQTIKEQKKLLAQGQIDHLPWEDLLLPEADNIVKFGANYPANPVKGQMFVNITSIPSRLFKYNGNKWIEVDKEQSSHYAYNDAYIDYLIEKISKGEYDTDSLTDIERTQIESKLNQQR